MEGTIKRSQRKTSFVLIDNQVFQDSRISWKAKGVLGYLLSKPDSWVVRIPDIIKHSTDGRDAVRSAINELIEAGYIVMEQTRKSGKFASMEYTVFDSPQTGFPATEKPATENPLHSNNNISNTDSREEQLSIFSEKEKPAKVEQPLKKDDQATNIFAKCYYPLTASYEMSDAAEKLKLYLSYPQNMNEVKQASRTWMTEEEILKYVNVFAAKSYDTAYRKFISSFPELVKRFTDWLTREKRESKKSCPTSNISLLDDTKADFLAIMAEKAKSNDEKAIISIFENREIKSFVTLLETEVKKYPSLSGIEMPDEKEWVKLQWMYDTKSFMRSFLLQVIEKIATFRKGNNLYKTLAEYGKKKQL